MTTITLLNAMGAACAAQRMNGRYIKRHDADNTKGELSNAALMREFLNPEMVNFTVLPEDIENAEQIIDYLNSKMVELIAGSLHEYWKTCVLLTEQKEFKLDDYRNLAVIASVPSSYNNAVKREQAIDNIAKIGENSRHIGKIGDAFKETVTIISAVYSHNYGKWFHTAEINGNLVRFPHANHLENNEKIALTGRIYKHDDNNMTRLHYVRIEKSA